MSFFKKITKVFAPAPASHEIVGIDAASFSGRRRHLEIAGEYYNQDGLEKVLGYHARDGVNYTTIAALVPNPRNQYDENAVEVRIDGHLVGHLSREQAIGYHKAMADAGYSGRALGNIEARIFGRPLDRDNSGGFGVAIYLPEGIAKVIAYE
jgi:hypothetical protein